MRIISVLLLTIMSLIACNAPHEMSSKHNDEDQHWSYTGEENPANWSHLSEEYKACEGSAQSPININDKAVASLKKGHLLEINYNSSKINIVNNGHTEQFNIDEGNDLIFDGKKYDLKQFHLHSLSEHTINGEHLPLEVHFVNKAEDGTYAVIAVLFEKGKKSSFFTSFLKKLPVNKGAYQDEHLFDIHQVLPETKHFYHYKGSFTTPPCTEVVEWIVLKEKMTASKAQLEELRHLLHDNYRPIQAVNTRTVEVQ